MHVRDYLPLLESSPIGMALIAPDGRWIEVNRAVCDISGYSAAELLASNVQAITHPDDIEIDVRQMRDLVSGTRTIYHTVKRYRHKTGRIVTALIAVALARDAAGLPLHFIAQIVDITAQREIELRLTESEHCLRTIADSAHVAIVLYDDDDVIRFANAAFERLGHAAGGAVGQRAVDFLPAPLYAFAEPYFLRAKAGQRATFTAQGPMGGEMRWFEITFSPYHDSTGKRLGVSGFGYDVTDRVNRDAVIQASEAKLASIFATMSEGLVVQASDGRIIEANAAAERVLGLPRDQILGRTSLDPHWRAIHDDGRPFPGEEHPGMVTLRTGQSQHNQIMGIRVGDQQPRWISINSDCLPPSTNPDAGAVIATFKDITEQRESFDRVRALARRLDAVREEERRSLALLLHEGAAQDLYAIRMTLEQFRSQCESQPDLQTACSQIADAVDRCLADMRQIANDLRPTTLAHLQLAQALEEHARYFGRVAGLTIDVLESAGFPALDEATRFTFFRAAQEALTNVAKHARASKVTIRLRSTDAELILDVVDDGVGIAPDAVTHGRGLGLLGIRERFESFGGRMNVLRNDPVAGTTFTVAMPRPRA